MRIPRVLRSERNGAPVRSDGVAVIAEERLREPENGPRAVVVGIDLHHASRENRRAPRIAIDRQLGQMTVRENPCVALRLGAARKLGEHGQHLVGVERVAQRPFDIPAQGVDVFALCSLAHTTLIAALAEPRNVVVARLSINRRSDLTFQQNVIVAGSAWATLPAIVRAIQCAYRFVERLALDRDERATIANANSTRFGARNACELGEHPLKVGCAYAVTVPEADEDLGESRIARAQIAALRPSVTRKASSSASLRGSTRSRLPADGALGAFTRRVGGRALLLLDRRRNLDVGYSDRRAATSDDRRGGLGLAYRRRSWRAPL